MHDHTTTQDDHATHDVSTIDDRPKVDHHQTWADYVAHLHDTGEHDHCTHHCAVDHVASEHIANDDTDHVDDLGRLVDEYIGAHDEHDRDPLDHGNQRRLRRTLDALRRHRHAGITHPR